MIPQEETVAKPFGYRVPGEGSAMSESRPTYVGLIRSIQSGKPELHGYVVTLEGNIVIPELRPRTRTAQVPLIPDDTF